ncbi:MAG: ATP-grasp domain-containing protein, partial [Candidatus Dormibacteria bacterium]
MATVLLVLPVQTYRAHAFLSAARRAGLEVVVASDEASSLAAFMADRYLTLDLGRPEEAADRAAELAGRRTIDGVVGVDETAVLTAAAIAERLGLSHHPLDAVAATRDKRRMRALLARAGVAQPEHLETSTDAGAAELGRAHRRLGPAVVVKPVDLAASRGVIRADDTPALVAAVARVRRMLEADPDCGRGPWPLLVERFAAGPEVAVEGLVEAGRLRVLAVFDKPDPLDGPFFEETIFVTPSRHPPALLAEVRRVTEAAVAALGLREGPIHAELRLGEGVRVLEVAARSIGGLCSAALDLGGGRTLEEVILRRATGMPLDAVAPRPGAAAVLMLPTPEAGVLGGVAGLEAARAVPGVDEVVITIPPGQRLVPLPEGDRYLGFVTAHAATADDAEAVLRRARAELRVRLQAT